MKKINTRRPEEIKETPWDQWVGHFDEAKELPGRLHE